VVRDYVQYAISETKEYGDVTFDFCTENDQCILVGIQIMGTELLPEIVSINHTVNNNYSVVSFIENIDYNILNHCQVHVPFLGFPLQIYTNIHEQIVQVAMLETNSSSVDNELSFSLSELKL